MTYQAICKSDLGTALNQATARGLQVIGGQARGRGVAMLYVHGGHEKLLRWLNDPSGVLTFYGPSKVQ